MLFVYIWSAFFWADANRHGSSMVGRVSLLCNTQSRLVRNEIRSMTPNGDSRDSITIIFPTTFLSLARAIWIFFFVCSLRFALEQESLEKISRRWRNCAQRKVYKDNKNFVFAYYGCKCSFFFSTKECLWCYLYFKLWIFVFLLDKEL